MNHVSERFGQRRICAGVFVLIATVTAVSLAGSSIELVLYRLLTDGVLAIIWLIAAGGIGTIISPPRHSPLRLVTSIAIGLGVISLLMLLLGMIGFLNQWICMAIIAVGAVLAIVKLATARIASATLAKWLRTPTRWGWLWLLAAPFFGIALVAATVPPGILWGDEPNGYDVLEYHLQIPREWYETGRISALDDNAFGYFPQGVEMHYLLAMELRGGPWAGMYLAQFMHLAFVVLSIFAVYAAAQSLGAGIGATVAGVAAAVVPWMTLLAPIAYNEGGLLLYGSLAIGWTAVALRAKASTVRASEIILAGVCTGLACGVKLTAVPEILIAIPIATLVVIVTSRRRWLMLGSMALFVAVGLISFAPWMARNTAWTGNPVFPEAQKLLGNGPFTSVQTRRWQQAHSPTADQHSFDAHLAAAGSQIIADWRYGFVIIPLGVLAGLIGIRRAEARFLLVLLILQFIFWIAFTHLQGRFFILAIPIGALMIGEIAHLKWLIPAGAIVAVGALISLGLVLDRFVPMASQLRAAQAFGIEDLSFMTPADTSTFINDGASIGLVGDARAFVYQLPMLRLHYRTVFDVKSQPGEPIIQAWLGSPPGSNEAIVMDPPEIRRLSRTYYDVADLAPSDPAYGRMPFVIPPKP